MTSAVFIPCPSCLFGCVALLEAPTTFSLLISFFFLAKLGSEYNSTYFLVFWVVE